MIYVNIATDINIATQTILIPISLEYIVLFFQLVYLWP